MFLDPPDLLDSPITHIIVIHYALELFFFIFQLSEYSHSTYFYGKSVMTSIMSYVIVYMDYQFPIIPVF